MRVDCRRWVSSRGLINRCNKYVNKDKQIMIIRYPHNNGGLVKRYDSDSNGILKRIISYLNINGKVQKTIENK